MRRFPARVLFSMCLSRARRPIGFERFSSTMCVVVVLHDSRRRWRTPDQQSRSVPISAFISSCICRCSCENHKRELSGRMLMKEGGDGT